ncbi:MAG TPA: glycosyltransferase [Kribbella sp.]|uniref:glycosyltransferase n=1 Tax=Kribbella sp. TaxID=1871183 RepID=UPI002D7731C8|nr:glycosyltransferase [Kribbella sp.]HET6297428.1 glycosyltransferase [Kribbella sp.]
MICLLPHCAYLSETSRMLEIHRALTELGLPVRVATHGGPHERLLHQAGIQYDVLGPGLSPARAAAFVGSAVGLGDPRQSMYDDAEIRGYVQAETEYFRSHGITVAVTGFTLTTLLSSRLTGVRLITEHAGSFVPPIFERRPLPSPSRMTAYCGGFNRVAASLGIEGIPSLAALLLGDLSLVPEVPEVLGISAADLAAWTPAGKKGYRAGSRLTAVGPLFAHLNTPLPERAQKFLDRPGTIHDLADLATDQILIEQVLPSHLVMPQVDLAITTGGQGSVQTAMASGTPLLSIPLQPEQDLNAALVERLGAARHLAPAELAHLPALTTTMLNTREHALAAERIQKLYAATDGPAEAARIIAAAA